MRKLVMSFLRENPIYDFSDSEVIEYPGYQSEMLEEN